MHAGTDRVPSRRGPVRGPQSLVSGLVLVALALFAIWLTSDLPQGTLRAMGPAMLPRWLAVGIGLCGIALVVVGLTRDGHPLEGFSLRGPVVVGIAILCFGLTIRGFAFGALQVPQLGLLGAGPLAIFISGFATHEARFRELAILALALTSFCMVLFGDLLNLPIPMYPQVFADLYPSGWSSDARLRATAGILVALAVIIFAATHRRRRAAEPIDVVPDEHAGTI
ncbi:tripartite tricarboxylate transporter TctB family protein [Enterovirga aerilata]|uniref:Tripartite tricarboxylate transporter TctB family protein n=1 Tax=Enterovirga aerilata TaxID=2730920 RepID=A0A849I2W2_9HYPH|nr:tripartite tricarboxylate transporter TctB family protein [Enterovirga sp. DB1703]NNM71698.1 tripartite tricarboxylate transporter TctB family protein [Enterovirga sp. DB1703]